MRIPLEIDDTVAAALGRLGRTEDAQFSPSGRRLALVGTMSDRLAIFDVDAGGDPPQVQVVHAFDARSSSFKRPHGVAWLDERAIAVANRDGGIAILELPDRGTASGCAELNPVRTFGADRRDLVKNPGSVSAHRIGQGLVELLVCNNYVQHISRHLIDLRDGYAVRASDSLICDALDAPDGVAHSPSGRWIAVSNHYGQCVVLFRNDDRLHDSSVPQGVLRGVHYPHGLAFSPDDKWILVADADSPSVRVFRSEDGNWEGEREPVSFVEVLSQATFDRGRFSPGEGGPKGIDLTPDGTLLVTTCEQDQLALFDVRPILGNMTADPDQGGGVAESERVRAYLLRYLAAARTRLDDTTEAIRRTSEREVQLVLASRWWRLVMPLRRLSGTLQYAAARWRHWLRHRL